MAAVDRGTSGLSGACNILTLEACSTSIPDPSPSDPASRARRAARRRRTPRELMRLRSLVAAAHHRTAPASIQSTELSTLSFKRRIVSISMYRALAALM